MPRPLKAIAMAKSLREIADLPSKPLQDKWREVYGSDPPKHASRTFLTAAVSYRLQEKTYGKLSAAASKALLDTLAEGKSCKPQTSLMPGTVLLREWQGTMHEVTILEKGVLYRERRHRSLTGVARLISGIHRSGPEFFGIAHARR